MMLSTGEGEFGHDVWRLALGEPGRKLHSELLGREMR